MPTFKELPIDQGISRVIANNYAFHITGTPIGYKSLEG